jgi:hypothetical protein
MFWLGLGGRDVRECWRRDLEPRESRRFSVGSLEFWWLGAFSGGVALLNHLPQAGTRRGVK